LEEDEPAMTELRLAQANLVGPVGYVSMEDGAVGNFIQRAIPGAEAECSVLEMGGFGHVSEANRTTEASVRSFWHAYWPLMGGPACRRSMGRWSGRGSPHARAADALETARAPVCGG
jgi:hypothetical protein